MRLRLAILLFGFCYLGQHCQLFAQEENSTPESFQLAEILVEDDREHQSLAKPSAFATIIHPEDYADELTTLPEILSRQPGVFVRDLGGLGQRATVSIRGSTPDQVSVFIDGVKINTAQGGAVDFSSLPLEGVERVEVLRGGSSSQFGSDAIGGVINIITKKSVPRTALQLKGGIGSFLTFETQESFSKRFQRFGFNLSHTHLSSKGDFPFVATSVDFGDGDDFGGGGVFDRIHNEFFSESALATWSLDLSPNMRLDITENFFISSRNQPGAEAETTILYPENPLNAHENLIRNTLGLGWTWNNAFRPDLQLSVLPYNNSEFNHFTDATPALGNPIDVYYRNQNTGLKNKWYYEIPRANQQHRLTGLYDFSYQNFNSHSPLASNPAEESHQRITNAVFLQDEIDILGDKIYLNPSARWEKASGFDSNFSGHFGITGRPFTWLEFKGNVENAFRYPSFNELYLPDEGYIRGNPDLQKEASLSFDIGAQVQKKWARLEMNYFRNQIDNSILFVPVSAFTIAPLNTGPALAQGLETSLQLDPLPWFGVSANYTYIHSNFKGSSKQLPGRPRQLANIDFNYQWKHVSLFNRWQYIDGLALDFPNTKFLQNRLIVSAGGTYKWKDRYFITLEAKNIGNVQSADTVGFPLPRRSFYFSFGYQKS